MSSSFRYRTRLAMGELQRRPRGRRLIWRRRTRACGGTSSEADSNADRSRFSVASTFQSDFFNLFIFLKNKGSKFRCLYPVVGFGKIGRKLLLERCYCWQWRCHAGVLTTPWHCQRRLAPANVLRQPPAAPPGLCVTLTHSWISLPEPSLPVPACRDG